MRNQSLIRKTIYIPVEFKVREFVSHVLLAAYAADKGFRTYIGTKAAVTDIIYFKDKGGIFFYKGTAPIDYMRFIKSKTDLLTILDQEIGPVNENYEVRIPRRFYPGAMPLIDRYYVIGPLAKEAAEKTLKDLKGEIIMTGWPRVDLWRERFSGIYEHNQKKHVEHYGEFLLFTSDFGYLSEERLEGLYLQIMEVGAPGFKENVEERMDWAYSKFNEFKDFIVLLREWDEDKNIPNIVIRPHPSEDISSWEKALKGLKKTFCVFEGEVGEWISASVGVVHRGCTSAVQSYIVGKPTAYIITNEKRIRDELPYKLSAKIRSKEDLKEWLKKNSLDDLAGEKLNKRLELKDLRDRIYINDKYACELIVEDLLRLYVKPELPWGSMLLIKLKYYFTIILRSIKKIARKILKKDQEFQSRYHISRESQKVPGGITSNEVKSLLDKLFPENNYQVRRVMDNAVMIEAFNKKAKS